MNNLYRPGMVNLWHVETCPWYVAFTVVPIIFISFAWQASLYCEEYVYIDTCLIPLWLYMKYHCYQITKRWNIFTKKPRSTECWLDMYHCGVRLVVT